MEAGAPFFFGEVDGFGVSLASGVTVGLAEADGDSSGDGLGVGELLCFFFLLEGLGEDSGEGLGDDFFFFGEALGVGVSVGVGLAADFFFGDADFSGVAEGFGVGDFSAVDFFFVCFRGAGVGVAKIFFSVVGKDSAAGARTAIVVPVTPITQNARAILIVRCIASLRVPIFSPALRARLCSSGCRLPDFRAENSHSANERGNRATPVPSTRSRLQEYHGTARRSEWPLLRG